MVQGQNFWRIKDSSLIPDKLKGAVIAIGNFDGVHQGHQAVLKLALQQAKVLNKPALVFTFEPHPRSFFKPQSPVYRLTTAAQKANIFQEMGFDGVIEQSFTADFAHMPAETFVEQILKRKLAITAIIAGSNFHFGYKRQGTPLFLQQAGQELGFTTKLVDGLIDKTGAFISSSRIRSYLETGNIEAANTLLGHAYSVNAPIISGQALGRTLGFPTANMELASYTQLKFGIYAVFIKVHDKFYQGVASFGRRPTIEDAGKPLLETYIFNFDQNIYGEQATVKFISFLRGEEKFNDIDALIKQMHKDAEAAKYILSKSLPD